MNVTAGPKPKKLQLGRFGAKNKRPALPQPSMAGTAASASATLLHMLQHHKAQGTRRISLPSRGVHTAAALPAPLQPTAAVVGHSAALGVCKCLPYELPSLANEPIDYDAASAWLMSGCDVGAEQGDMYGVAMAANSLRRPLMHYRSGSAGKRGSAAVAPSSTYVITGKPTYDTFLHVDALLHVSMSNQSGEQVVSSLVHKWRSQGSSMCKFAQAAQQAWAC